MGGVATAGFEKEEPEITKPEGADEANPAIGPASDARELGQSSAEASTLKSAAKPEGADEAKPAIDPASDAQELVRSSAEASTLKSNGIHIRSPIVPVAPPPSEPPVLQAEATEPPVPLAAPSQEAPASQLDVVQGPLLAIAVGVVEAAKGADAVDPAQESEDTGSMASTKATEATDKPSEKPSEKPTESEKSAEEPGDKLAEKLPKGDPSKIRDSLKFYPSFYNKQECATIEAWINDTEARGAQGLLGGPKTLDQTASRSKYFFGHGYTYGRGMRGKEELLPLGSVAAIPGWVRTHVIQPLEKKGIVRPGWIDSCVLNDYRAGSSIVAHIDPPALFARPIITATFFSPAKLVFGASFDPARRQPPAYAQMLTRGSMLMLDGYAANNVTHGIRPEDLMGARRVSLILRHVIAPDKNYKFKRLPSSFAQNALGLICKVQGVWCTPSDWGIPSKYYVVRGLSVTVLEDEHNSFALQLQQLLKMEGDELPKLPSCVATWRLEPAEDGIICNGGYLHHEGASEKALSWSVMTGQELPLPGSSGVAAPRYTWLRAGN